METFQLQALILSFIPAKSGNFVFSSGNDKCTPVSTRNATTNHPFTPVTGEDRLLQGRLGSTFELQVISNG